MSEMLSVVAAYTGGLYPNISIVVQNIPISSFFMKSPFDILKCFMVVDGIYHKNNLR